MFQAVSKTVTAVQQTSCIVLEYNHFFFQWKEKLTTQGMKVVFLLQCL